MTDTTTGTVGDDADQVAQGKRNQQLYSSPQQSVTFTNPDSMQLWVKLLEVANTVSNLVIQMDDLPNRVGRLERLEVVVKPGPPPEVIVRPLAHDTVNLSVRMIVVIFLVSLVAAMALVAWLVFLQVANV